MEQRQAGNRGPRLHPGACQGWRQGASAPASSAGAVGVSLGQSSVLPPPPPHFEVVPENAARSQTLSVWKEATSSDGARSRHGCVA